MVINDSRGCIFNLPDRGIYERRLLRFIVSLAATLLTLVLVYFATPYVSDAIAEYTPLDDMIKSQVVSTMANAAASQLGGGEEAGGMDADSVRKVLQAAGVSEETLAQYGITIDDIVNGNISSEDLPGSAFLRMC